MKTNSRKKLLWYGFWFFLINALPAVLISYRYMKHFADVDGLYTFVYLTIVTLSHFAALSLLLYILFYIPLILIFPNRHFARSAGIAIVTIGLIVLILDTFVFDLYRFHINKFTLELIFGGAASQIFEFHAIFYILAIATLIIILFLEFLLSGFVMKKYFAGKYGKARAFIISLACMVFLSHFIHAWAEAACYKEITRVSRFYPLYFPTSASDLLYKTGFVDFNKSRVRMEQLNENKTLDYPKNNLSKSNPTGRNILFIIIDSWYYKSLNPDVAPNMSLFADSSLFFANHYSGSNGTRTGIFSLFYSLPGTYWYDVLSSQISPVFINSLLEQHYQIGIFSSASLINPPFDRTVFTRVRGLIHENNTGDAPVRDLAITQQWMKYTQDYVAQSDTVPFFGFLFYDAPHSMIQPKNSSRPFQPAWQYPQYQKLNNNTDPTEFLNLYRNVVHYVDSLVGVVLQDLSDKKLLGNTIVVITGDHSQEFNDNKKNYWGHNGNYSRAQMCVPLIIHWPGKEHKISNQWTCHYDIVPTLMHEALGYTDSFSDYGVGKSLFDTAHRDWLLVGSFDNFGILEKSRITTVNFDRTYQITDTCLNELPDAQPDAKLFSKIIEEMNSFYAQ